VAVDYVSKWVEAIPCHTAAARSTKNVPWHNIPHIRSTKGSHQWWGIPLHWWETQKILENSRSRAPSRYPVSSPNKWPSWNMEQANLEHPSEDCPRDGKRMER
jgi:hypothetical protein